MKSFRAFRSCLLIALLIGCLTPSFGLDTAVFFNSTTGGCNYIALGKAYQNMLAFARMVMDPKASHQFGWTKEILESARSTAGQFIDWDASGVFRPTGIAMMSASKDKMLRLEIEAQIKPRELLAIIRTLPMVSVAQVLSETDELVSLSIKGLSKAADATSKLEISKTGILLTPEKPETAAPDPSWDPFRQILAQQAPVLAFEWRLDKIDETFRKNVEGLLSRPGSKGFDRVRGVMTPTGVQLVISTLDAELKETLKKEISEFLPKLKEVCTSGKKKNPASSLPEELRALTGKLLDRVTISDQSPWFGIVLEGKDTEPFAREVNAGIAALATIMQVNFAKAKESARTKGCWANQRVVLGAVEMYNLDHDNQLHSINDKDSSVDGMLSKSGYLRFPLRKPEPGCSYGSQGDLASGGLIICPIHGSPETYVPPKEED